MNGTVKSFLIPPARDGVPQKGVSRKGHEQIGFRSSLSCSQGGCLERARQSSKEVVQFPWSLSPMAGFGIGCREGGLGRKERGNSQDPSVSPWLDVGASADVESSGGAPMSTEGALANPEAPSPVPWPSAS